MFASACASYSAEPLDGLRVLSELTARAVDASVHDGGITGLESAWFPLAEEVRFDDGVSLAEANVLALAYAPAVRIARAEAGVAAAGVRGARLLRNPQAALGPRFSVEDGGAIFPISLSWQAPLWG
ncbi:MAG: hypothetical protein AAFP86_18050, partial [Planctomycetota bacterium]